MNATAPLPPASGTVPSYLVWSIIVTVLAFVVCCFSCLSFPAIATGIVAIVFGTKVNTLLRQGDLVAAQNASRNAKIWAWVTSGILIAATLGWLVMLATVGMDGYMEQLQQFQQQIESSN